MNLKNITGVFVHFNVQSKSERVVSKIKELNICVIAKSVTILRISDC